jgi:CBS domain-containing protein/anti-sigma regulatory factor (Ser/Thr protein kinase)
MNTAPAIEQTVGAGDARKVSVAQVLIYELRVRDAMSTPPITAGPDDTLRTIQLVMKAHRFSGVPITKDEALVGIVTIEDIINALDKDHISDPAERWMRRNVVTLRDHFSLVRAVAEFERHGFGRFPVLDTSGRLVGIITRSDVTSCLMRELERRADEALAREAELVAAQATGGRSDRVVVLRTQVKTGDYDGAGKVSQRLRQILRIRGIDPDTRRRAAIVTYEAETNIIIHSIGGEITVKILPEKVEIDAVDGGPGIDNIEQAMQEGWSTAGRLPQELGFGAGMGLPNIKRCSDKLEIASDAGRGTRLHSEILIKKAGTTP